MGVCSVIVVNIGKAKEIAHNIRRYERAKEFAPLDIKATIPSEFEVAEAARQAIREKYAEMQTRIDAASNPHELKQILNNDRA